MTQKIILSLLGAALIAGCTNIGNAKNSTVYKNYNEPYVDGFCYATEENISNMFIVRDKDTILSLDGSRFVEYETKGLLDKYGLKTGDMINVTFDVQRTTGGIDGVAKSELLKVFDCKKVTYSDVFKSGIITDSNGIYGNRHISSYPNELIIYNKDDERFICFYDQNKYTLYTEKSAPQTFDEQRTVYIPAVSADTAGFTQIGVKVLCNKNVIDDDIIKALKEKTFTQNDDIMLLGFCQDHTYDEKSAYADVFADAEYSFYGTGENSAEIYKVITSKQFEEGITAEELGIDERMFYEAKEFWNAMRSSYARTVRHADNTPYDRDILIIGGPNTVSDSEISFDKNANVILDNGKGGKCDYAIICTDGAFFDIF